MPKARVRCRAVPSVAEEVERCHAAIARRAHELYAARGASDVQATDDWLRAEAELIWKPAVEVVEAHGHFIVEAATAGVDARELDVEVSSTDVLIRANIEHRHGPDKGHVHRCEFRPGHLFRAVPLPHHVDAARAHAEYRNGLLTVVAPLERTVPPPRKQPAARVADALSRRARP